MATEKITGIVLGIVKHNDKHNIVSLLTETRGKISLLSPISSGKNARMRNARLFPLSVIETEIRFKRNNSLHYLNSFSPVFIWHDIYFNPIKSSIAYFLSDFLNHYFRDLLPEPSACHFIIKSLHILNKSKKNVANFHIWFLLHFLDIAGIKPDFNNYEIGDTFDMRIGIPVAAAPEHNDIISPKYAESIPLLLRMNSSNFIRFKFNSFERKFILDKILKYYSIHFPGLGNLKSYDILTEIFS